MFYPWQAEEWKQLQLSYHAGHLAHAYLLSGDDSLGQNTFSFNFTQWLLCSNKKLGEMPCGVCDDCRLFLSSSHPDFYYLHASGKDSISIDDIRSVQESLNKTARRNNYQVIVIDPVTKLNPSAMASLLKTLEEPVGSVMMMLIDSNHKTIPSTVLSRCQLLRFSEPNINLGLNWLKDQTKLNETDASDLLSIALYSPLRAIQLHKKSALRVVQIILKDLCSMLTSCQCPLDVAKKWQQQDASLIIWLLYIISIDLSVSLSSQSTEILRLKSQYLPEHKILFNLKKSYIVNFLSSLNKLLLYKDNHSINRPMLFQQLTLTWVLCLFDEDVSTQRGML